MSYIQKHAGSVIVSVPDTEWDNNPLQRLKDWVYFELCAPKQFSRSTEGEKLYQHTWKHYWGEFSRLGPRLRDGEKLVYELGPFCRLFIEKIPCIQPGHLLRIKFVDFKGESHKKYAENFVNVLNDGHGGCCGLELTEVLVEHRLLQPHSGRDFSFAADVRLTPLYALSGLFSELIAENLQPVIKEDLIVGLLAAMRKSETFVLPPCRGIQTEASFLHMGKILSGPNPDGWLRLKLEPDKDGRLEDNKHPVASLKFTCIPEKYDLQAHCYWYQGRSLRGFAKMVGGFLEAEE